MASAKQKPLYDAPADYEDDYCAWLFQQAELLRLGRFRELDLPNLVEEIEDMGRSQWRAFESHYRVLLVHLLKWEYQPDRRTRSWLVTIGRERAEIEADEQDNRSFRNAAPEILRKVYPRARIEASTETGLAKSVFPEDCPYALAAIRDADWLPGPTDLDPNTLPPLDE